jgi:hypothetical protein
MKRVTGDCGKLLTAELYEFYSSPYIIKVFPPHNVDKSVSCCYGTRESIVIIEAVYRILF